jgi:hypothetical protein
MTSWFAFSFLLLACSAGQPVSPEAPLAGRWQFQQTDQLLCLPNGTVVEKILQCPPQTSERWLEITATQLISHHARDRSFPDDTLYAVPRFYTRRDSTLLVSRHPGDDATPVRIRRLTDQQLSLWSEIRDPRAPDASPYTVVRQSYTRQ